MAPAGDGRYRSGEHRADRSQSGEHLAYVTQGEFVAFVTTFKEFAKTVNDGLTSISNRLSSGSTSMTLMDGDVRRAQGKLEDQSEAIAILKDDLREEVAARKLKEATELAAEIAGRDASKPMTKFRETVVKTIIIVATTGGCALIWDKLIRSDPPQQPAQTNIMVSPPAPVVPPKPPGP